MLNLRRLLVTSTLFFSVFSAPLLANQKILRIGAIPDQNQDVLDKRFNLFSKYLSLIHI